MPAGNSERRNGCFRAFRIRCRSGIVRLWRGLASACNSSAHDESSSHEQEQVAERTSALDSVPDTVAQTRSVIHRASQTEAAAPLAPAREDGVLCDSAVVPASSARPREGARTFVTLPPLELRATRRRFVSKLRAARTPPTVPITRPSCIASLPSLSIAPAQLRPASSEAARSFVTLAEQSFAVSSSRGKKARRVPLPKDAVLPRLSSTEGAAHAHAVRKQASGVPTFVMMPLDLALHNTWLSGDTLERALTALVHANVRGVMVDVWWRLCERDAECYDFGRYAAFFEACRRHALQVQVVMAFHGCGGNVGDDVSIALPHWVKLAADANDAWFLDRARDAAQNREYISIGADHVPFLPGSVLRTPVQAYAQFVAAFCERMETCGILGSTICEIQVGVGPCGELRYPSYPLRSNKWSFPGVGEFQCFDHRLLDSLVQAASLADHPSHWAQPPTETGEYKSLPKDVPFFKTEFATPRSRFFLQWYSDALVQHCDDILDAVRKSSRLHGASLAVKIAGVHWHYLTASRAAEATAGYHVSAAYSFYEEVALVLAAHNAVLNFTCLEMATEHQPANANAAPRQLVHDVFELAARCEIPVAGENALPCCDPHSFRRVADSFRWTRASAHSFTLLRLSPHLLEKHNMHHLRVLADTLRHL